MNGLRLMTVSKRIGVSTGMRSDPSPTVDVVGTAVTAQSLDAVVVAILTPPPEGCYVAVANVHSLMMSRRSDALAQAMQQADIVTPDGMPLVWMVRATGHPDQDRVHGMAVVERCLRDGVSLDARHYFYGSSQDTLDEIRRRLPTDVKVVGTHSPPFRPLTEQEIEEDVERMLEARPTVVWVGLGAPKQELWMHQMHPRLPGISLVGVGAVFDWLAGRVTKAPEWMQRAGLEWLYRLSREPKRLWRRYVWNNPVFLLLAARQLVVRQLAKR